MATPGETQTLNEASPSVQSHLSLLQDVIQRMAENSASSKAWCITLVSAILVLVADEGKPEFASLALVPALFFLALDAYYLALEKGFRAAYNDFVKKVHEGRLSVHDLYAIAPLGARWGHQVAALKSFSVWGFYITLIGIVFIAQEIVMR